MEQTVIFVVTAQGEYKGASAVQLISAHRTQLAAENAMAAGADVRDKDNWGTYFIDIQKVSLED